MSGLCRQVKQPKVPLTGHEIARLVSHGEVVAWYAHSHLVVNREGVMNTEVFGRRILEEPCRSRIVSVLLLECDSGGADLILFLTCVDVGRSGL